jgi:hypothetical protein
MSFEVRSKSGKYYVVNTTDNSVRGRGYDDEGDAEDKCDDLNFRLEVRDKLSRVPVTEMTSEEKAAAYDKMLADKAREQDANLPPKNDDKTPPPTNTPKPKSKRFAYWGDVTDES